MKDMGVEQSLIKTLPQDRGPVKAPILYPVNRPFVPRVAPIIDLQVRHKDPLVLPERPQGFSRVAPQESEEAASVSQAILPSMAQELTAIEELIPTEERTKLELLADDLFKPETKDPIAKMQAIVDPTNREFVLRTYARMSALNLITNGGVGARFNIADLESQEKAIYDKYKKQVFSSDAMKDTA